MTKLELKEIIKRSGLSREDFAAKLNISMSTLNTWSYRELKIPNKKALLIHDMFNKVTKDDMDLPFLRKDDVTISVNEIFDFILNNEEEILKNHKMFKLWISEKVYRGIAELSTKFDSK